MYIYIYIYMYMLHIIIMIIQVRHLRRRRRRARRARAALSGRIVLAQFTVPQKGYAQRGSEKRLLVGDLKVS